jgi:hypothetical protein
MRRSFEESGMETYPNIYNTIFENKMHDLAVNLSFSLEKKQGNIDMILRRYKPGIYFLFLTSNGLKSDRP